MTKNGRPFFDTNILIYAFTSGDPRSEIAGELLAQGGRIGVQNLNEFAAVASRKLKMPWPEVQEALTAIRTLCPSPVPLTLEIHEAALKIVTKHQFRIYDATIVAAAIASSSPILYSEDLRHGQVIAGVTVQNQFKTPSRRKNLLS